MTEPAFIEQIPDTARRNNARQRIILCLVIVPLLLSGCSMLMSSAASDMMANLSRAIADNDDLKMVESGSPAYLLMIDSLILKDPENEKMLSTAATLYASYADLFVRDPERSKKMADKAMDYAERAVCVSDSRACGLKGRPFEEFDSIVRSMGKSRMPALFALGNAWARWIMVNKSDFNAIADIAYIETIMQQVVRLDPAYRDGAAHLYLGTLASLLPPAMGGKPEQSKEHFEKALALSEGKNLMARVLYAKFYARMIFDRDLHDHLLRKVMEADPAVPGYTLINTWAQKQAAELLLSADDYF